MLEHGWRGAHQRFPFGIVTLAPTMQHHVEACEHTERKEANARNQFTPCSRPRNSHFPNRSRRSHRSKRRDPAYPSEVDPRSGIGKETEPSQVQQSSAEQRHLPIDYRRDASAVVKRCCPNENRRGRIREGIGNGRAQLVTEFRRARDFTRIHCGPIEKMVKPPDFFAHRLRIAPGCAAALPIHLMECGERAHAQPREPVYFIRGRSGLSVSLKLSTKPATK